MDLFVNTSSNNKNLKLLNLFNLQGDKNLTGITHVIVDEVHERSLLVSE